MSVRKLEAPKDEEENGRVETGAVQFGGDWPGLFIRGDTCIALFLGIEALFKKYPELERDMFVQPDLLKFLAETIDSNVLVNHEGDEE